MTYGLPSIFVTVDDTLLRPWIAHQLPLYTIGRIVGAVSTSKYFAPQLVAGFMRAHPDVDMKLFVGNRAQTIVSLKDHRIDVALMGRPPRDVPVRAAAFGDHPAPYEKLNPASGDASCAAAWLRKVSRRY